ncbi:BrnT family toxin [Pseudanabaena sp. PCC 6802]|uniref:BrnT family toxin n=1 Tax=Pseudanabaena sp. PCC 6802 TaxID=118173 RepID=UPI00034558AF|nr:BrnT family toxin [Pseudanabaena sp. PCC 6802]
MSYGIKPFRWNTEKNNQLQAERGISFEVAVLAIAEGKVLDVIEHPNQERYPSQRIFIIEVNQYVYLVPFVESTEEIFLKTIIPSRKLKKKYLGD